MRDTLIIVTCVVGILVGGMWLYKNSNIGCVDYIFGKACGVNVVK